MRCLIKVYGKCEFSVDLDASATVGDVRNLIVSRLKDESAGNYLVFTGRILQDFDTPLQAYNIADGACIYTISQPSPEPCPGALPGLKLEEDEIESIPEPIQNTPPPGPPLSGQPRMYPGEFTMEDMGRGFEQFSQTDTAFCEDEIRAQIQDSIQQAFVSMKLATAEQIRRNRMTYHIPPFPPPPTLTDPARIAEYNSRDVQDTLVILYSAISRLRNLGFGDLFHIEPLNPDFLYVVEHLPEPARFYVSHSLDDDFSESPPPDMEPILQSLREEPVPPLPVVPEEEARAELFALRQRFASELETLKMMGFAQTQEDEDIALRVLSMCAGSIHAVINRLS